MRLPSLAGDPAGIDEDEVVRMLRYAIDHGVNYLDLGYPCDMEWHERLARLLGRALKDGYRQKVKIAANLPSFLIDSPADFDRYLDDRLKWLQTGCIDFFLFGGLDRETWPRLQEIDVLSRAEAAMADGRIDKVGFGFHDYFQTLREILDAYDNWALCQLQYSYMDIDHHPGVGGIRYAASEGLAVVVTESLKGGRLTRKPPESVAVIWTDAPKNRPLADWGLRWVWNHPEVATVVSDMSTLEQVAANVALADAVEPDSLTVPEEVVIGRVRDAYRKLRPVPCTACRGCMPCPLGIDVPRIFELYNDAVMYDDVETARSLYRIERHDIDSCNECGACVAACGLKIPITDRLKEACKLLAGWK
ncbi:MAG: aldo/keto reductase [Dehalococcoidales bacterium]|nr:aldo/keto reductase [Dehalococcoidales bacterium]